MNHQFVYQNYTLCNNYIFTKTLLSLSLLELKPRSFCFTPNFLTRQIVVQGGIKTWDRYKKIEL